MIELTDSNFKTEILDSKASAIVDFWAPWCGPCKIFAPIFDSLSKDYGDKIKFGKVNIDENMQLAQSNGVRSIPTILIFKEGKEVDRINGAVGREVLKPKLDKL